MESDVWGVAEIVAAIRAEIALAGKVEDFDAGEVIERFVKVDQPAPKAAFDGYVDRISIAGIRSFGPQQTLRPSRGLTIVYADNGIGKTSLVDGLELLLDGRTTRGRAGAGSPSEIADDKNVPHVTRDGSHGGYDSHVEVVWSDDPASGAATQTATWEGRFGTPAAARPPVHVLARRRLRDHLRDSGSERAARLGEVVGLGSVIEVIEGVREVLTRLQEECGAYGGGSSLSAAVDFVEKADILHNVSTAEELREWAREQLADAEEPEADLSTPIDDSVVQFPREALAALVSSWLSFDFEPDGPRVPATAGDVLWMLESFVKVATPEQECPACTAGTVSTARLDVIRDLLRGEREYVEQLLRRDGLGERARGLARQFAVHARVPFGLVSRNAGEGDGESVRRFRSHCHRLERLHDEWLESTKAVADALRSLADEPGCGAVDALEIAASRWKDVDDGYRADLGEADRLRRRALGEFRDASAGETDRLREVAAHADRILSEIVRTRREELDRECLGRALAALKTHQTSVTDALFDDLADPINEWLCLLAPDSTPGIRLRVKGTAGRPALSVLLDGGGQQVHAVGRLSDSQLDMLGLAAHLAAIERQQPGATIVIDDPSDMLDGTTRKKLASEGIARLLGGQADDAVHHQVVILTHDDELVRELWDAHRGRRTATLQYHIEAVEVADDRHARVLPRNTATAIQRVRDLVQGDKGKSDNLLWFRASLATSVRQAMEMLCKDIATILGPVGLDRIGPIREDLAHGGVSKVIAPELVKIEKEFSDCGEPRHNQGRNWLADVLDLIDPSKPRSLNAGAHADVVVPTVASSKAHLESLEKVAKLLGSPAGNSECSWTMDSKLAKALQACECDQSSGS